jgi:hypothetical protein
VQPIHQCRICWYPEAQPIDSYTKLAKYFVD